ncbi:pectin lyase-like protein [Mycena haematopus]|nr:pectin lyase-like protein [Mycena haematopus]
MLFGLLLLHASVAFAWDTFLVPHTPGGDDTPGLLSLVTNHSSDATILFSKGITYNIFTAIKFPVLTNVEIGIEGNLTYPTNISEIQGSFPGSWFTFSGGNNVTLRGSTDPKWGWVDGHGQAWWDAVQQVNRPHGWAFNHITNGVIRNMKLWKPIGWNFATSGSANVHVHDNLILAVSDTSAAGFSAGGNNLLFENNHVVNGDDCLTVGSGAHNITWRNSYCEGGHGLSIGSLGSGGSVADVQNKSTLYGARFKSWTGGNGLARKSHTWKDITFIDVPFPSLRSSMLTFSMKSYWDQDDGPRPNNTNTLNNTHIQDFLFDNFVGVIRECYAVRRGLVISDPCWYFVPNATGREVAILDLYPGTATNVVARTFFRTETGRPVAVMCNSTTVSDRFDFDVTVLIAAQGFEFERTLARRRNVKV